MLFGDRSIEPKHDIDIMDALHIPSIYHKEDTQHGIQHGDMDNYQKTLIDMLSEKYDIPHELFEPHMKTDRWTNWIFGSNIAENRFMYNAAKANGWDFHPTPTIPYPKDEHGWPLTHRNEQLSGNALKLLFSDRDEINEHRRSMQRQQAVRHPLFGPMGEEKALQPPTKEEWNELWGSSPHDDAMLDHFRDKGLSAEMKDALIELRERKQRGVGNETV